MIDVDDDTGISLFLFIGEYQAGDIKPSEEGFLEWVPIERIAEYPLVEDLHVLIPRLLKQKETFLFGNYCFEGDKLVMAFLD
jgi:hypothetical protein